MARKSKRTTDAVEILHRRFYAGRPKRIAALEEARANDDMARQIYETAGRDSLRPVAEVGVTALDPRFAFGRAVEKAPILAKARSGHSEEPSGKAARSQDLFKRQLLQKESRQIHADEHHSLHQWTMGSCDGRNLRQRTWAGLVRYSGQGLELPEAIVAGWPKRTSMKGDH